MIVVIAGINYSCKNNKLMLPTILNTYVIDISNTTATSGATISDDGGAPIQSKGVCWNTTGDPTLEDFKTTEGFGTGAFKSKIVLLTPGTLYYLRAYATNLAGTAYGSQQIFTTSSDTVPGKVTDIEGNTYNTIVIGTQTWMRENLKTTKYRNNSDIPLVTGITEWFLLTTPGYCWYDNNVSNKDAYGALYNWFAVDMGRNPDKNICPFGWHVPSDAEWNVLISYLGGDSIAIASLKETGNDHWDEPNADATNESGFTALPAGARAANGAFFDIGGFAHWWSSTAVAAPGGAWSHYAGFDGSGGTRFGLYNQYGLSIRCVKDN